MRKEVTKRFYDKGTDNKYTLYPQVQNFLHIAGEPNHSRLANTVSGQDHNSVFVGKLLMYTIVNYL